MHRVLARQLKRHGLGAGAPPQDAQAWRELLSSVDSAYQQADQDRYLLERSLALSSEEMAQLHQRLRAERDLITRVTCSLGEGVCAVDRDGRLLFVNPEARRLLKLEPGSPAPGKPLAGCISACTEDGLSVAELLRDRSGRSPRDEVRLIIDGDTSSFVTVTVSSLGAGDDGVVLTLRDITERKRMEIEREDLNRRLEASEQRYALAARGASDGLWDWDLQTNRVYYSARWRRILGLEEEDADEGPQAWLSRVHPNDAPAVRAAIDDYLAGGAERLETEHRLQRTDGAYIWVLCRGLAVRDGSGRATRLAGSISDISLRKETEDELRRGAYFDKLTGLPNRDLFRECLEQALRESRRGRGRFAVLFLDFDNFKVINDSLGHLAGDELLVGIAARLSTVLKETQQAREHTLARLGGDEFVVLLKSGATAEGAISVVLRILESLERPFRAHGAEVHSTASIGIAVDEGRYSTPEEALRDADTAMYHAKAAGPGRYCLCDESMRQGAIARLKLENELRRSIAAGAIGVAYQPIMSLVSGQPVAVEALARWTAEGRPVSPDRFIPLAEETGLIVPLGEHVLRSACRDLRIMRDSGPAWGALRVNVNLSGRQFAQSSLVDVVMRTLRECGLPAQALALEVTETVIMEDFDAAAATIRRLRELGVEVYMDDFGTGYSSLSCLKLLPLTGLKLDRGFLTHMDAAATNPAIIHAIVTLANHLQLQVVAEGVETPEHLASVLALDCGQAQGYLFGRAMPLEKMQAWLADGSGWRQAA